MTVLIGAAIGFAIAAAFMLSAGLVALFFVWLESQIGAVGFLIFILLLIGTLFGAAIASGVKTEETQV